MVIGGQMRSKNLRGFLSCSPAVGGRQGILAAVAAPTLPLQVFALITYFLPPWGEPAPPPVQEQPGVPQWRPF